MARITSGYSPAMIDQVCSMALTYAHADGRDEFSWNDLVEAMTVVEAGVAINQPVPEHEARATAIHEAGHAVCSHIYNENRLSTRLSIKRRGATGGHHQAMEIEERFGHWRSEEVASLIWTLGAMAAEYVFYGQNTTGVAGDLNSATTQAAWMVGVTGMGPTRVDLSGRIEDPVEREEAEKRIRERTREIGAQILHRSGNSEFPQPMASVLGDRTKRDMVVELLGQAFVLAYATITFNKNAVDHVASRLEEAGELYGDDVENLLKSAGLNKPAVDLLEESTWPTI
jgi:hypothetical protein